MKTTTKSNIRSTLFQEDRELSRLSASKSIFVGESLYTLYAINLNIMVELPTLVRTIK